MKHKRSFLKKMSLFSILSVLVLTGFSQDGEKFHLNVGLQTNMSYKYGDASALVNSRAIGTDSLWGLDAAYQVKPGIGYGIEISGEYDLFSFLVLEGGLALKRQVIRDELSIWYEPAVGGVTKSSLEIVDRMIYFSPSIAVGGKWKWISLTAGGEFNFYVSGKTDKITSTEKSDGEITQDIKTVKATTWDQPIYKDPNDVGGVQNYTSSTGMNHGLNPNYFSPFVELKLNMPKVQNTPFVAFRYAFVSSLYRRSNNPAYSLVTSYNPGTLDELNLGSSLRSLSITVGWTF
jgi:hypothetical protein